MKKFIRTLINILYGIVGGMNIVIGLFYTKNFYQIIAGCLFMILLIDRFTIKALQDAIIIDEEEEKNSRYTIDK